MTAPSPLPALIAEGLALETGCGHEDGVDLAMARGAFYRQHGPALLDAIEAADVLFAKVDAIEKSEAFRGVFAMAAVHGAPYRGATWETEKAALDSALSKLRGVRT